MDQWRNGPDHSSSFLARHSAVVLIVVVLVSGLIGMLAGRALFPQTVVIPGETVTSTATRTVSVTPSAPGGSSASPSVSSSGSTSSRLALIDAPLSSDSGKWSVQELQFGGSLVAKSDSCAVQFGKWSGRERSVTVALGGRYNSLSGTLFVDDQSAVGRSHSLELIDASTGRSIWTSDVLQAGESQELSDVPVSGIVQLTFLFRDLGGNDSTDGNALRVTSHIALMKAWFE